MINRPRGTYDVLPDEAAKWQYLERVFRKIIESYGYEEIRTPVFEETELFRRSIGEATDIVEKEMYSFTDQKGRSFTLRPEGTASVIRAYLEAGMRPDVLMKLYYYGDMFRYDRPQKGRYRQFRQMGVEAIGSSNPAIDAEVISLAMFLLGKLGISGLELNINSVGCIDCRGFYYEKLKDFIRSNNTKMCNTCQARIERNPMRVFDCKEEDCKAVLRSAPKITDSLCQACRAALDEVKKYLSVLGIVFVENPGLVRGLDYYTRTAFEIICKKIDSPQQNTIIAGGRYDNLVKDLGGPDAPAVGWAMGMERILLAVEACNVELSLKPSISFHVASLGDKAFAEAFKTAEKLRRKGFSVNLSISDKSLKAQMREANRLGVRYALILGDDELSRGVVLVRDMQASSQKEISLKNIENEIASLFIV